MKKADKKTVNVQVMLPPPVAKAMAAHIKTVGLTRSQYLRRLVIEDLGKEATNGTKP